MKHRSWWRAAWLHDIGYAPGLKQTGFHPLDWAQHLRATGLPELVCGLVAHHSGSRFVAQTRGLDNALTKFDHRESDALTTADQTIGRHGQLMTVSERSTTCCPVTVSTRRTLRHIPGVAPTSSGQLRERRPDSRPEESTARRIESCDSVGSLARNRRWDWTPSRRSVPDHQENSAQCGPRDRPLRQAT